MACMVVRFIYIVGCVVLVCEALITWRSRDLFVFSQAESVGPEKAREEKRTRSCLSAPVEGGDGDGESRRRSP